MHETHDLPLQLTTVSSQRAVLLECLPAGMGMSCNPGLNKVALQSCLRGVQVTDGSTIDVMCVCHLLRRPVCREVQLYWSVCSPELNLVDGKLLEQILCFDIVRSHLLL